MSQAATTTRADGARWLQDPDRIAAHTVYLAADIRKVALTTEARTLHGRVDMPTDHELLPFLPDPAYGGHVELPLRGMPARLEYGHNEVSYAFDATMAGVDERGRWLITPPRLVECSDRRLVHRHSALGDPAFELELDGPWQPPGFRTFSLLDISTDGLGFIFHPYRTPLNIGEVLEASLLLPTTFMPMDLVLRVANIRSFRTGSIRRVAGARYVDLLLEDRRTLALSLSVWDERRKVA